MEEPTAILTFFRQCPEVLKADIIEENTYLDDVKKKGLFPVILPFEFEKNAKCNTPSIKDERLDQQEEEEEEEAEDCSVEELTNRLNIRDTRESHRFVPEASPDSESDCVEFASDAIQDVVLNDNLTSQSRNRQLPAEDAILQWEERQALGQQDEFEPFFEEEEVIQRMFPDVSTQPLTSPMSNIQIQALGASRPPQGSTTTRATFSPSASPPDKQIQLPALFSGLRVLRKGGADHDTISQFKPISQTAKGTFLDQISQLLNRDKQEEPAPEESKQSESSWRKEEAPAAEARSSADAVFDAFKSFFTPKPLKKDPSEKLDLDAVRKKIRNETDLLRTVFEKTGASDGKV